MSDNEYGVYDLFEKDELYQHSTLDGIARAIIEEANTPAEAAAKMGVGKRRFAKWMQNDDFKEFMNRLVSQRDGSLKHNVTGAIESLKTEADHVKVGEMSMKLLERINPDFGKKSISVESKEAVVRVDHDAEFKQVVKAAEEAANKDPDD